MTRPLLVLRPEPGASATAARARAMRLDVRLSPLFQVGAVAWIPPDAESHDALMLTSANAVRHAGPDLHRFATLPLYVVGEATARAARAAGLEPAWIGRNDAQQLLDAAGAAGIRALLHLCGREHRPAAHAGLRVERRIVYAAEPVTALGRAARDMLAEGAVALLHSPRAAALFARLIDAAGLPRGGVALAALSPAVADAAGSGWGVLEIAAEPRDDVLLAVAARMCE